MKQKSIIILFSGNGSNMEHILQSFHSDQKINVIATITNNPKAKGIERSKKFGLEPIIIDHTLFDSREAFDTALVNAISRISYDLVILAGFMRILTPIFTESIRAINLHPSYLPHCKGSNAIKKSFESELGYGGVSIHYVSSELDGGEVILQKKIYKDGYDFARYQKEVAALEKELLLQSIIKLLS